MTVTNREIKYVLLRTQYRMHEQFMKFPNEQFYGGKLNVGCTNEIDYLQTKYRVIFIIDTMGEETKDSANSYKNDNETIMIVQFLKGFIKSDVKTKDNEFIEEKI